MSKVQGRDSDFTRGFEFLMDGPATVDEFKSHQRVADAIATTVECSKTSRIIGLVGPWGSGKSTVVQLLKASLDEKWPGESTVYVFDAWTHHGEPVRRAFLEEFRTSLGTRLKTDESIAQRILEVTGRATITRTQEVPSWTPGGVALLASLAVSGYGLAKGHSLRSLPGVEFILSLFPAWLAPILAFIVPVATLVAIGTLRLGRLRGRAKVVTPLSIAAALSILGWLHALTLGTAWPGAGMLAASLTGLCAMTALWPARPTKKEKGSPRESHGETLLGLIMTRQHQDKSTKISGMGVPTAVEFSKLFQDMVGKVDGAAPLVVVIDNLDRLPPDDARELWSMLRTFFLSAPKKKNARRPFLLVPLAAASMEAMYKGDQTLQPSRSFMEKTFDVLFHVPTPIFTNWAGYFASHLEAVLHINDATLKARAVELLDAYLTEKKESITPRRIKALVNLIATYKMQRDEPGISFEAMVFYCINKADIDDDLVGIISNKDAPVAALDPAWQSAVVALHHGVSADTAIQVVLEDAVERAVGTRDTKALTRLLAIDGVAALVHRMVLGFPKRQILTASHILNLVHTLAGVATVPGNWEPTFSRLANLIPRTMPWRRVADEDYGDLRTLVTRSRFSLETVKAVSDALSTMDPDAPFSPQTYGGFWRWMASEIGDGFELLERIMVPGHAAAFVDVAAVAHDMPPLLALLVPTQPERVPEILTGDLDENTGIDPGDADLRLVAVFRTQTSANWHNHLVQAVARYSGLGGMAATHGHTIARLSTPVLAALLHAARDESLAGYVRSQAPGVSLAKVYDLAAGLEQWTVAARAAATLVVIGDLKHISFPHASISSASAEQLANAFADALSLAYPKHGPGIPLELDDRLRGWPKETVGAALERGFDSLYRQRG